MPEHRAPDEIIHHYESVFDEDARLSDDVFGEIEALRTLELLDRFLPEPPARLLDVGGGPGYYARRLSSAGYEVHLIDPVPRHVAAASKPNGGLPAPASACIGDARSLGHDDGSFDGVLVLGPLYHLTERRDRILALREAARVTRPGGPVLAAAISRFASAIDGLDRGLIDDPEFVRLMGRDLADGQHRNPPGDPRYFTTAFLHHPDELRTEMADAGLEAIEILAVEGISWVAGDLAERMADPAKRSVVFDIIRRTESDPALLGASPHLLGVGHA